MSSSFFIIIIIILALTMCRKELNPNKKRVLLIGIDGFLSQCMDKANVSSFKFLEQEGSYTYKGRTIIETISGPGWVSTLCGLDSEDTGITNNEWRAPWLFKTKPAIDPITGLDKPFPCLFSELKKNRNDLNITVTWAWSWFVNLGSKSMPGSIDKEYFCNPQPEGKMPPSIKCDEEMLENGLRTMNEDFEFLFVYFGSLDECGHIHNFCGDEYIQRMTDLNVSVERLLTELKTLGIYDNTYVILTTDHGARNKQYWHGQQEDSDLLIPFFIKGPNIKKNYELTETVRNSDVPPTILKIFNYNPNRLWRSRAIDEAFFKKNDITFKKFLKANKANNK